MEVFRVPNGTRIELGLCQKNRAKLNLAMWVTVDSGASSSWGMHASQNSMDHISTHKW